MINRTCSFSAKLSNLIFPDNLVFIAACNPYRISSKTTTVGLEHDPGKSLIFSHRVFPIPESLISSIWDFGKLSKDDEAEYIRSMVSSQLKNIQPETVPQLCEQ
jgi:hypothetical protein